MTRLEHLRICQFRGIVDLDLTFSAGSIILGGANGTGKSACVDAIEFLYTGSVATLTGTQGLSLKHHGAHIQAGPRDSSVSATFGDPEGTIARRLGGELEVTSALRDHLERGNRLPFILRRSQVQQFIHAKPADRYRSMADLIGVEGLDRTEISLKRARDTIEQELLQIQARLSQVETQLETLPQETPTDDDLLAVANGQLDELGTTEHRLTDLMDVPVIREAVLREVSARQPDERLQARGQLLGELRRGVGQRHLRDAIEAYFELLSGAPGTANARTIELLQLLRKGREYVHAAHPTQCPICERSVDQRVLLARLVERVAELEDVSLHDQRLRQAQDELSRAVQDTSARLRNLSSLVAQAGLQAPSRPVLDAATMLVESIRAGALIEIRDMAARIRDTLARWEEWAGETILALDAELTAAADESEDHQRAFAVLGILEQLMAERGAAERGRQEYERLLEERDRLVNEKLRHDRTLSIADTTFRTFNWVKNAEIQRIYDELRTDLARMYDFLHPGEGHAALAISVDPRKRGSSELRMGFFDRQDEDPRAFASEGHLDSLGLCIFLAFVRRFNQDWPLLVLDDVVASVDAGHKRRIAELLFRDFGDRQLFVTTQDSRWFLDLQRVQQECGAESKNLIIESWSLETGPKVRVSAA